MREIKFRAWVKTSPKTPNRMIQVKGLDFGFDYITDNATHNRYPITGSVLMQYTGINDRNGKDVYEGDLWLPIGGEMPRIIKWHKNGFWMHHPKTGTPTRLLEWPEDGEVIGNIYQNPELVKSNV